MQTIEKQVTLRKLRAEEGKYLVQAGDIAPADLLPAVEVTLGPGDSAENWREIDAEEAAAIRAARETAYRAATEAAGDVGDVAQVEEPAVHGDEAGD